MPGPYSLMIARFPALAQEHPDSSGYVMGLMELLHNDDRIGKIQPWRLSDTPITMSRNRCVKQALDLGIDYLLMIDADMSPDTEPGAPPFWETAWEFMMERRDAENGKTPLEHSENSLHWLRGCLEPATIAAPYCGPPPIECVYVFRWAGRENVGGGNPNLKLEMYDRDHAASLKGVQEVAALPTGLILYDMRVFRKLPPPWFEYEWADPPYNTQKASTEDVYQTRNASMLGLPQFCAWDCWAGHIKTKVVTKPQGLQICSLRAQFADAVLKAKETHLARARASIQDII